MTTSDARKRKDEGDTGFIESLKRVNEAMTGTRTERALEAILSEVRALRDALTSPDRGQDATETSADTEQAPTEGQGADAPALTRDGFSAELRALGRDGGTR